MLTVTDAARENLDSYFKDKDKQTIRIYLAPGGCSGPRLSLALDDAKPEDDLLEACGYSFAIDKELRQSAGPIAIDCGSCGFSISSSLKLDGGCCGSCSCS